MSYDDSDAPSSSSSAYFESPAKAKREALKQKLKAQNLTVPEHQNTQTLKLSVLKSQFSGKKDEETKRQEQSKKEEKGVTSGTKTREQALTAERSASAADQKTSPDSLVREEAARAKAEEELREEEQTSDAG